MCLGELKNPILGFRAWVGFRAYGLGSRAYGLGFRAYKVQP